MGPFSVMVEVGNLMVGSSSRSRPWWTPAQVIPCSRKAYWRNWALSRRITLRSFRLADERLVEYPVGSRFFRVRLDGDEFIVLVVFAPEGTMPLLGATTP